MFRFAIVCLFFFTPSLSFASPINANRAGVAINGFDTVSYHTNNKAIQGLSLFQANYMEVQWWFSSLENKTLFEKNPSHYAPQYAGHCANGLSDGHLVKANPKIFRIIDGDLYLFFSWWGKAQWKFDQQEQIKLASEYWAEFSSNTD